MLLQLQKDLHNVLWGGGGTDDNDVFSSLTNLILSKIQDEDEKEDGDTYDFQSMTFAKDGDEEFETNEKLFDRINELYRRALKSKLYIWDEKELGKSYVVDTKKFSLSKLKYAVQKLEGLSFVDGKNSLSGKDILGDFFEGIIRDGFKQSNGQFDLILTNPPFSVELDNDTKKTIKHDFMFGEKKNSENLFIERWYQLLRDNGRVAAVLPESVFDTTENKYIRLFLYKYFKIKAVVSLPQLAFEPYTSTKTSILFAQKKTKEEISDWNEAWDTASKDYSQLKTRVGNLISVYDGKKLKAKLSSIKKLTPDEEVALLRKMLKHYISDADGCLDTNGLIGKYREELELLCKPDKDTKETFGPVNTWWVFSEVAATLDYSIFMAEAESIGYKRSKRRERLMQNELYRTNTAEEILIDDGNETTILDAMRKIVWD